MAERSSRQAFGSCDAIEAGLRNSWPTERASTEPMSVPWSAESGTQPSTTSAAWPGLWGWMFGNFSPRSSHQGKRALR